MRKLLGAGLLGALLDPAGAQAVEYTRFLPLPYALAAPDAGCDRIALMNVPPAWQRGDAAVLLLTRAPLHDALRDVMVATLLDAGAAVVEAVSGAAARCGPGEREEAEAVAAAADPRDVLLALLHAAQGAGAGLAVAVGYGPGAEAALGVAGAPGFAAAAAFGAGPPVFLPGAPMPAGEAAPLRLGLFCAALDSVADGLALPCRAALAPDLAPPRRTADLDR
jgi:hypothetical protein